MTRTSGVALSWLLVAGGAASDASAQRAAFPADPDIAPDGGHVAWVVHAFDPEARAPVSHLMLADTRYGRARRLTEGARVDLTPRFSPDGRHLAWVTGVGPYWEIRVRDLGTGRTRELAVGSRPHETIEWSPDGSEIAYTREVPDPGSETGPVELFVVSTRDGTSRRIARDEFYAAGIGRASRLSWVRQPAAIVLSADPGGDEDLYEVDLATGRQRPIAAAEGADRSPTVSPDGRLIAYTRADGTGELAGTRRLFVVERVGRAFPRLLSGSVDRPVSGPVWSPDGRGVYAVIEGEYVDRLALFAIDGSYRIVADSLERPVAADGRTSERRYAVSADSANARLAVITSGPRHPPAVGLGGSRRGDPVETLWTTASDVELAGVVGLRARPEGTREDPAARSSAGWAMVPDGAAGRPAIYDARDSDRASPARFDASRQAIAAAGYVVLMPARGVDPDDPIRSASAGGLIDESRVYRLDAVSGLAPDEVSVREGEPDPPFAAVFEWGPPAYPGSPARARKTLEHIARLLETEGARP